MILNEDECMIVPEILQVNSSFFDAIQLNLLYINNYEAKIIIAKWHPILSCSK